jgi:hypothetical protein
MMYYRRQRKWRKNVNILRINELNERDVKDNIPPPAGRVYIRRSRKYLVGGLQGTEEPKWFVYKRYWLRGDTE